MMADEISNIKPSDVEFLQTLRVGPNSSVFKVKVRGQLYAMKVHHGREIPRHASKRREWNLFIRESTAYRLLKEKGLCARRLVPDFYGTVENIQPAEWPVELGSFREDELPPNAIILEYLPDLHRIDLTNFSEKYLLQFSEILLEIHSLGILHDDPYPRNMVIVKGEDSGDDRAMWIDFDSSMMIPLDKIGERERYQFNEEKLIVQQFGEALITRRGNWTKHGVIITALDNEKPINGGAGILPFLFQLVVKYEPGIPISSFDVSNNSVSVSELK